MRFLLCLLLSFFLVSPSFADQDPRLCIQNIGTAVKKSDAEHFAELVDIDAIARDLLSELERLAKNEDFSHKLPPVLQDLLRQGAFSSPFLQPVLVAELRKFVLDGVGSGAFNGEQVPYQRRGGVLASLLAKASRGKKEISEIGYPLDGDRIVPFTVKDENGSYYAVVGLISSAGRLVAVQNLRDLIYQVLREAR